jgi:hypothetical protein
MCPAIVNQDFISRKGAELAKKKLTVSEHRDLRKILASEFEKQALL